MRDTRKLQFAAELIEEVSENATDESLRNQLSVLATEVDEARKPAFQEQLAEELGEDQEATRTQPTAHTDT